MNECVHGYHCTAKVKCNVYLYQSFRVLLLVVS